MPQENSNDPPTQNLGEDESPRAKSTETKARKRKTLLIGALTTCSMTAAGILWNIPKCNLLAILLSSGAFIGVGKILEIELINHGGKHWRAKAIGRLLMLSGVVFCACLVKSDFFLKSALPPLPPPRPNFVFSLIEWANPESLIALTNDFLVCTNFETSLRARGAVVFPTAAHSNLDLCLGLRNSGNLTAEDVEVTVVVPHEFDCHPGQGWVPVLMPLDYGDSWRWNIGALHGVYGPLSDGKFSSILTFGKLGASSYPIIIIIEAKDFFQTPLAFRFVPILYSSNTISGATAVKGKTIAVPITDSNMIFGIKVTTVTNASGRVTGYFMATAPSNNNSLESGPQGRKAARPPN
ncbi:MAG TPA: hypothetical protein VHB20_07980 [Verrucomicrobiae bacterium]|jgi:hypothetical protein|nr:hypothetical protein [Verrucomicrobiae bacterium]